jgi:hypothetical protein
MKLRHAWVAGLAGLLFLAAGIVVGQQKKAAGVPMPPPHLFRIWSDAKGDTHIEEIKLAANRHAMIPGATVDFHLTGPANPAEAGQLHHAPGKEFAITVTGTIDVEAADGTKARIGPGDIAFLDDTTGKGHKAVVEGSSISLRVADNFDVRAWARGE